MLLSKWINDPTVAQSDSFAEEIEGSFEWLGAVNEDIQEISYYTWLKSKMLSKKFYEAVLDLMKLE